MESMTEPGSVIQATERQKEELTEQARGALEWFLEDHRRGKLAPRPVARDALAQHLGVRPGRAESIIGHLASDVVDPVQQVQSPEGRYVGVIEYRVFQEEGAYGYVDYHDRFGERRRVVCARCVEVEDHDEHISHATEGEGTAPDDAGWQGLLDRVTAHYAEAHQQGPASVEPGATLVANTTIGGNTAWHDGNVAGSGGITVSNQTIEGSPDPTRRVVSDDATNKTSITVDTSVTSITTTVARDHTADRPERSLWTVGFNDGSAWKRNKDSGSIVTQFSTPSGSPDGIDINEKTDCLWIIERGSDSTLYKVDGTGTQQSALSMDGDDWTDVAVEEKSECLWVVDNANGQVKKLDQTGSIVESFAAPDNSPAGIGVNEITECLWVAGDVALDYSMYQVDRQGSVVSQWDPGDQPDGMSVEEPSGCLWIAQGPGARKKDQAGNTQSTIDVPCAITGIDVIDHDGEWYGPEINKTEFGWANTDEHSATYGSASGCIWYTRGNCQIIQIDQEGNQQSVFSATTSVDYLDKNEDTGCFWAGDTSASVIRKYNGTGSQVTQWTAPAGNCAIFRGIAVDDRDGCVWVSEKGSTVVFEFDQSGNVQQSFQAFSRLPRGIDIDERTDCIWLVDDDSDQLARLNQNGSVVEKTTLQPSNLAWDGLTFDERNGSLWVADSFEDNLFKVDQSGSQITQVSRTNISGPAIMDHDDLEREFPERVGVGKRGVDLSDASFLSFKEQYGDLAQWSAEWSE